VRLVGRFLVVGRDCSSFDCIVFSIRGRFFDASRFSPFRSGSPNYVVRFSRTSSPYLSRILFSTMKR